MNAATFFLMAPPEGGGGGMFSTLIMFGAIGLIFYFMIIRPQSKRMKEHRALVASVKKGDRVTMNGGLHGRIHEVNDTTVQVEIARNTIAEFERGSIQSVHRETEV
jgi:preprotein translocase subunit YajC